MAAISTLRVQIALTVNGAGVAIWRVRLLLTIARLLGVPMSRVIS